MPIPCRPLAAFTRIIGIIVVAGFSAQMAAAPQIDSAAVIQGIDRSVIHRDGNVLGYTVTERYTVFRNGDEAHPAAEMSVETTYTQNAGKSYRILSEDGPALLRKEVLERALENEKSLNQPANRIHELITSANYSMTVTGKAQVDGRDCLVVTIAPRQNAAYLFKGRIWVDERTEDIVRLDGVATQSASLLTGPAQVVRSYATVDGFPMATHASATVSSWLLGPTRVEIEYTGYAVTQRAGNREQGAGSRD
ncbi:MAG: sigma-E factor regulatory protein RseB domain-containing protein [Terracidiphilus sp.]